MNDNDELVTDEMVDKAENVLKLWGVTDGSRTMARLALKHAMTVFHPPLHYLQESAILRDYQLGNLTKVGVANHLRRAGFNIDYATEKANSLE